MERLLESLWRDGKIEFAYSFPNSWEEDLFRSQLHYLPEPEPGRGLFWQEGDYWVQVRSKKSLGHPYAETIWIDEAGTRYQVLPKSLLRLRKKSTLRKIFSAK